jgi:anti-sigma28 factor (negative regulator of flagellin synthesis)
MRIDNHGTTDPTDAANVSTRGTPQTSSSSQQAEQIALHQSTPDSTYQSAVSTLVARANQQPEIRQEKVAALAKQVHAGAYDVTPSQTSFAAMF